MFLYISRKKLLKHLFFASNYKLASNKDNQSLKNNFQHSITHLSNTLEHFEE